MLLVDRSVTGEGLRTRYLGPGGITLISVPVSPRKCRLLVLSRTNKMWFCDGPVIVVSVISETPAIVADAL